MCKNAECVNNPLPPFCYCCCCCPSALNYFTDLPFPSTCRALTSYCIYREQWYASRGSTQIPKQHLSCSAGKSPRARFRVLRLGLPNPCFPTHVLKEGNIECSSKWKCNCYSKHDETKASVCVVACQGGRRVTREAGGNTCPGFVYTAGICVWVEMGGVDELRAR